MTNQWNVGSRYSEIGEFCFLLRRNDPYEKHLHYNADGNKDVHVPEKEQPVHGELLEMNENNTSCFQ